MHVERRNVTQNHQLVTEAMWGDLHTRTVTLMVDARKVIKVSGLKEATHRLKCEDVPLSKKKCARTPILVGKDIEMEFANEDGSTNWWLGCVTKYNSTSNTYEAFFRIMIQQ